VLVDFLAAGGAKVIALDVVFTEADDSQGRPFQFLGRIWTGPESDARLANSVRKAGNVIMVADASYDAPSGGPTIGETGYRFDVPGALDRKSLVPPFAAVAAAAAGFGHNLFVLDADGPLRHVVPFVRSGNRVLPSLGIAAALRVAGIPPEQVRLEGTALRHGDGVMPLAWHRVPAADGTLSYLWGLINFRGAALGKDLKSRTYPTYSAFDLVKSRGQMLDNLTPDLDPRVFRNKIVFIGTTASGLFDVFETPFANGKMPGINIHAAVADDILSGRFLHEPDAWIRVATVLASALVVGAVTALLPAWWATAFTLSLIGLEGVAATRLFAGGEWLNLSQPVLASSFALFGSVAYQYVVEGREKRKMKKLFGQYVSKDVYDRLVADPSLARLGGARREMTVLFSDIRGFTTVSERGQPEEIVRTLNEYFTEMVDIVFRHRGTLDKFVGDMVMALFGAPVDDPDHADHAVKAALEMIRELGRLNERWKAEGRPELDIGIGINTGPMIAGNIGSEQIMSYTVIGDAVNLGSRLESLNKQYGTRVIISETTRSKLNAQYEFRALGEVVVKGRTQPVAIFEVVRRTDSPEVAPVDGVMREARL
jgi:adenylate cyclase